MPRASTGSWIKAKTSLASSAGYPLNRKLSIVDRDAGSVVVGRCRDRSLIPATETANLAKPRPGPDAIRQPVKSKQ
jgi:hypothetical protein